VTPRAEEVEYEGLHCTLCGEPSGNTDWCVPCASRVLDMERMAESGPQFDDEWSTW
jgi:hypothetical protein